MQKISVHLTDEQAEELRRVAFVTGRSQSDLIRDGVQRVLLGVGLGTRQFHSLGKGHGGGGPYQRWDAAELYISIMESE